MYTLISCRSFTFVKKCPLTQVKSVTRFSCSNLKTSSTRVATSFLEKKENQEDLFKRNYVSVGGRNNKDFNLPNIDFNSILNRSKQLIKEVPLSEMAKAPQPAFWYGFSSLVPFVLPSLSFIIFGYSPFLGGAQLAYGATVCSFLGGVKWGYMLNGKVESTWESLGWSVGPQLVAWIGLLMPQTLGFIVVSGSLLTSAFGDLTMVNYPQWYRAMRLTLTVPAVISLLLTAIFCLFH